MSETFTQLTPHLWVTQSPLYATNSGIFISAGQACLIDPGIAPDELAAIANFVTDHAAVPRALVITHAHWDHMMGSEQFPDVPIITHSNYGNVLKAHAADLKKQVAQWAKHSHSERPHPFVLPQATYSFSHELRLTLGTLTLHLLPAPGHAPDQLVLYHAESGTLWAADMLSDREIPLVMGSLNAYAHTLARLAQFDVRTLVPGHGTPTTDPVAIQARFAQDHAYLTALREYVRHAVASEMTQDEVVAASAAIPYAQPADNATAHRWNVESCFAALGGEVEGTVGWDQDWEV